jgi:hypothetical protein
VDLDQLRERMAKVAGKKRRRGASGEPPVTTIAKVEANAKRKNSRTKGNSYERKVAKKFADWCGETIRRTPMSGGWSSAQFGVTGDLVCDNPKFYYHVECKKREQWQLEDLITGIRAADTRSILEWWKQTTTTCPKGKYPTLVFSRNNLPDLIMLRVADWQHITRKDFTAEFMPTLTYYLDSGNTLILALDLFLAKVRPPRGTKRYKAWTFDPSKLGANV